MSFAGQPKSWIRKFKINFCSWKHIALRIKKHQHLVNFQALQRFPFNSSQKANQDVCIFAMSCFEKGPPLPLRTDLFRIQLSLSSDFKLLKTNERSEAMPNLQALSDGKHFVLSPSLPKPRANQVSQLTLRECSPPSLWVGGRGELTFDKMGAFNFKFSQGILYHRCFSTSLFIQPLEGERRVRNSRFLAWVLGQREE